MNNGLLITIQINQINLTEPDAFFMDTLSVERLVKIINRKTCNYFVIKAIFQLTRKSQNLQGKMLHQNEKYLPNSWRCFSFGFQLFYNFQFFQIFCSHLPHPQHTHALNNTQCSFWTQIISTNSNGSKIKSQGMFSLSVSGSIPWNQ